MSVPLKPDVADSVEAARRARARRGSRRLFAGVLAAVAVVAAIEFVAVTRSRPGGPPQLPAVPASAPVPKPVAPTDSSADAVPAPSPAAPPVQAAAPPAQANAEPAAAPVAAAAAAAPFGFVDTPAADTLVAGPLTFTGWALARDGVRAVELRMPGATIPATTGLARPDVAQAKPGYPGTATAGFEARIDLATLAATPAADRRALSIVAIANNGVETVLARKDLVDPAAFTRWTGAAATATRGEPPFRVLPALSGIGIGDARGLDTRYQPYVSATVGVGLRVPILYLRTTRGPLHDYAFDPDWDIERRCGARRIADDSLSGTLAHATAKRLPLLVTLNGGVWADAACDVPAWDINDRLEQDPANCQWNEKNAVMADDALSHLPGSQAAPELGRSLTFNVYARDVRRYKQRNLQQAGRALAAFARAHPELFVGVNLDPDSYLNPFFEEKQWYDYNPGTLRQFRHWLAGSGPYAGRPDAPGVPDLSRYRRARPLSLAEVSALSGRPFAHWSDVDPPRAFPRTSQDGRPAFVDDPWTREWELFRRHLVHLHYDELARWLVDAGIPRGRIWSSQGFMAPHATAQPFAVRLDSPSKNYDTGGMSVEGAKPRDGHLGAILYGPAAVNDIRMEGPLSLFGTLRHVDPRWAAVEYNPADLRQPDRLPGYADAYRGFSALWNYGAVFVSPMAWNGSNGLFAGQPGFVPYTAWLNTPFEEAAKDFMLARAGLSPRARLWTFGAPAHADADGWVSEVGTLAATPGRLVLTAQDGRVVLRSPRELALTARGADRLVLGFAPTASSSVDAAGVAGATMRKDSGTGPAAAARQPDLPLRLRIEARAGEAGPWLRVADVADASKVARAPAGLVVPLALPDSPTGTVFDQLRVELEFAPGTPAALARIALLPPRR